MDTEYDDAIFELIRLKRQKRENMGLGDYIGVDIRLREGISPLVTVAVDEEHLPENTSEDDISRLKEKLELLKQIDALRRKLKKYDTDYVPYYPLWNPWPVTPWQSPFWCDVSTVDNININWMCTDSDGNPPW